MQKNAQELRKKCTQLYIYRMSLYNIVNRLSYDVRKVSESIGKVSKKIHSMDTIQLIGDRSIELNYLDGIVGNVYGTEGDNNIFNVDVIIGENTILLINVSVSFIVECNNLDMGSVVLRLRINDDIITENETILSNIGYNTVSLNYTQKVVANSLYNVEILYEGNVITNTVQTNNPILNTRKDGASLSIVVI